MKMKNYKKKKGMGNLLGLLKKPNDAVKNPKVFVDFENAEPTPDEKQLCDKINPIIAVAEDILRAVKEYHGAEYSIKKTIDDPTDTSAKTAAWAELVPLIDIVKKAFLFSKNLEEIFSDLLNALCQDHQSLQKFEEKQALSLVFAKILDFTLAFDAVKMSKPYIQNDFSYYRRTLSRITDHEEAKSSVINDVTSEMANSILLFFASPTPFLTMLSKSSSNHFNALNDKNSEAAVESFATLAKLCRIMVETPSLSSRFQHPDTVNFVLRVMTGLIILYDHVHPIGSFSKNSPLDLKIYLKLLKEQPDEIRKPLMHALMYTSKHFNDSNVPSSIKSSFS